MEKFRSREEFAKDLGLSSSTLRRKIKEKNIIVPKGLLSPDVQRQIKIALGVSPGVHSQQEKNG